MKIEISSGVLKLGPDSSLIISRGSEVEVVDTSYMPPGGMTKFLSERGWNCTLMQCGTYKLQNNKYLMGSWYTWEQAMAIEFYRFLTIGGNST